MTEDQCWLIVPNGFNHCSQILGMAIEAEWLTLPRLLVAPPVVGDYSKVVHSSGHPGERSAAVKTAVYTYDSSLRLDRCSLPDGEVGKSAQREGGEAVGSRIDGSDA